MSEHLPPNGMQLDGFAEMMAVPLQVGTYLSIGIGIFVVAIAILAYLGWKKTITMADFAIGSGELNPYLLGGALAATTLSAATFVGYVGWSYGWGLSNLWVFIAIATTIPILTIFIAKQVRERNVEQNSNSLPDWLGDYYNSDLVRLGAAIAVMFNIFYVAAQLSAGALIFETLLGWTFNDGLIFITVFVTIYVLVGGTFADVYTDFVQAILMAGMGVFIFASAFWVFDVSLFETFPYIFQQMENQDPQLLSPINPNSAVYYSGIAIAAMFILLAAFPAQPQLFNKFLALDDPKNVQKMIWTFIIFIVIFLLTIFGGFYSLVLEPGLESIDQAIFAYTQQAFPPIITAVLGIVILAAALSTTDGIYVVIATAVANDIFLKILVGRNYVELGEDRADRISRYVAQSMVIIIGAFSYLLVQLDLPISIGELVWVGISGVTAGTLGPIVFGLYAPGFVTEEGAITSIFTGVVSYFVFIILFDIRSVFVQGTYALIVAFASLILVSYLSSGSGIVGHRSDEEFQTDTERNLTTPEDTEG